MYEKFIDEEQPGHWAALAISLLLGPLLSFALSVLAMRSLVGVVTFPDAVLGLSRSNFSLVSLAASVISVLAIFGSVLAFGLTRSRWRWLALVPAVVIPLLCAAAFGLFLLSGLG